MQRLKYEIHRMVAFVVICTLCVSSSQCAEVADEKLGRELFAAYNEGFKIGKCAGNSHEKARTKAFGHLDAGSKLAPDDPRIDFARGLILRRLNLTADSYAAFAQATRRNGKPYWLAWRAVIWTDFVRKKPEDIKNGFVKIQEFAERLIQPDLDLESKKSEIIWIGEVMMAVKLVDDQESRIGWDTVNDRLNEKFGPAEEEFYSLGKQLSITRDAKRFEAIVAVSTKLNAKLAPIEDKEKDSVDKDIALANQKDQSLNNILAEEKAVMDRVAADYYRNIQELQAKMKPLEFKAGDLLAQDAKANLDTIQLGEKLAQAQAAPLPMNDPVALVAQKAQLNLLEAQTAQQTFGLLAKRADIAQQLERAQMDANEILRTAERHYNTFEAAAKKYFHATKQTYHKLDDVQQERRELLKKKTRFQNNPVTKQNAKKRDLLLNSPTFGSYIEFPLDKAYDSMLHTLGTSILPEAKPEKSN